MKRHWKSIVAAAGMLGVVTGTASALEAYVPSNSNLRWGPSTDFPIQVTVPAGSTVDVIDCADEWCNVYWYDYEGFIYRPLLSIAGTVTVPYVASYPDYEYYGGYYYGPTFVFRYYGGDWHSRRASRAEHHSRRESRVAHHSRRESRAEHRRGDSRDARHSRAESKADIAGKREIMTEAQRRQRVEERRKAREEAREERRDAKQDRREERQDAREEKREERRDAKQGQNEEPREVKQIEERSKDRRDAVR